MEPFRLLFEGEAYTYEEYLEYYGDERVASHLWSRRMLGLPLPGDVPQLADNGQRVLLMPWRFTHREAWDGQTYSYDEYVEYYGRESAARIWETVPEYVQFVVESDTDSEETATGGFWSQSGVASGATGSFRGVWLLVSAGWSHWYPSLA